MVSPSSPVSESVGRSDRSCTKRSVFLQWVARPVCWLGIALAVTWPSAGQTPDSLAGLQAQAEAYLEYLGHVGSDSAPVDSVELRKHLAQLALILPPNLQQRTTEEDLRGLGTELVHWWRSRDPLPASPINERLIEHVQRVHHSETHFASDVQPTGFDERGEVYVRYGRPERELVVKFDEPEFTDKLYEFGFVLNQSDFPANVFWRYGHIDGTGNYLFVEEDGEYRIAGTTELLPRQLRTGFHHARRGQRRAQTALAALRTIYRQLAGEHPIYLERFSNVDNYLSVNTEPGRVAARVLGEAFRREVLDQDEDTQLQPGAYERPVSEIIQSTITSSKVNDDQLAYQRTVIMPPTYTEVHRALPPLPVSLRTARFLEEDGQTRTEVYWSPDPGGIERRDGIDAYVLHLTAVQLEADYERRASSTRTIKITDVPRGDWSTIPAQTDLLHGDGDLYHLALQWDLHPVSEGQSDPGQRIRVGAEHVDSLRALRSSREVLEMSDLKPVMIWSAVELVGESEPYPYLQVGTDTPLGLYFEVYNLLYDEDDYTRYAVTHRIARVLQDADQAAQQQSPTSVTAQYTGTSTRDAQEVLLDLNDWADAGLVEVRVTVYDQVARRGVTRTILFDLS